MDWSDFNKLQLQKGEYVIFAGAALFLYGIRDSDDVDILVTPAVFKRLKPLCKKAPYDGLAFGNVEIFQTFRGLDVQKIIDNSMTIDNFTVVTKQDFIEMKMLSARPKDLRDIELIRKV